MVTQELINFIKSQLEKGVKRVEIEDQLLKNGWLKVDIDSAFNLAMAPTAPIEPTQVQPVVSEPVFEIKPDLTNEPTIQQTQQPEFQFSQEPKEQPVGNLKDLTSKPVSTSEISQENQGPQPIQPFKVSPFEDSQSLEKGESIESNLPSQDQNIFEPPLGQNQFQPQITKEEISQEPLQASEFQQPAGFSALDFSQVPQSQNGVKSILKSRNMTDILKIVVSFILGAGITFLILFILNDYSIPIGAKEISESPSAEVTASITPSPAFPSVNLNPVPYRNDNLGILRMDYPVGFSPTELFMPVSDLPFILPTGATNIVFNSYSYGMDVFLSISVVPFTTSTTTTATTTPSPLDATLSSQLLQEIVDNFKIQSGSALVQSEESRLIGQYEAKLIEFLEPNGMRSYDLITIIPEKSQVYYFKFIASQNYWEDFRPLFENIISQIELQ